MVAFSSLARIWGECLTIHSLPALWKKKEVEISSQTLNPLFMPGLIHSGSVILDDCGGVFCDELHASSFPDRIPYFAWTAAWWAHSDFFGSRVYACLGVTRHLNFWPEWPESFTCHCGNTGVEWTPNKSQHTKWTLEKNILPLLLPGFELATFRSWVWHCPGFLMW